MSDFSDPFRALVEGRFQTEFTLLEPDVPIKWDGVPFQQAKNAPWAEFMIMQNATKQVSIGKNRFLTRTTGLLQIDITRSGDKGTAELRRIAEKAADIFAFRELGNAEVQANFSEKHVTKAPAAEGFTRIMARVFFYYDGEETRP